MHRASIEAQKRYRPVHALSTPNLSPHLGAWYAPAMRVTVVFFARLRREAGLETTTLEVQEGATVRELATQVEAQHGLSLRGCMAAVNEVYAAPNQALQPDDEVAFLPPVAGGTDDETRCEVVVTPLLLSEADAFSTLR